MLLRHPDVVECSVVGAPDAEWGERITACVVARQGVEADAAASALLEASLDELCLRHMARFKWPREYLFLGSSMGSVWGCGVGSMGFIGVYGTALWDLWGNLWGRLWG